MPARPPSLTAVAAFEAAARYESFSRAAEELNLTRSAISHAIRGLEQRLGVQLFERSAQRLTLTPAGSQFSAQVRLSLSLLTEAFEGGPARAPQSLSIGADPGVVEGLLAPRLCAFVAERPEVRLEVHCSDDVAAASRGDFDLWIGLGAGGWAGLCAQLLAEETLVPVRRPAGGAPFAATLDEALQAPRIELSRFPWRTWLNALDRRDLAAEPSRLVVDQPSQALAAARAGLGVALVPRRFAEPDIRGGALERIADFEAPSAGAYYAVWSAASRRHDLIRGFVGWLAADLAPQASLPLPHAA